MPLRSFSRYWMVSLKSSGSSVRLSSAVASCVVVQLDVELHAAHAREVVLARVEEHALEQLRGGVQRRRIAGTQLAVDFDQRVALVLTASLRRVAGDHVPTSSRSGKKTSNSVMPASISLPSTGRRSARCWPRPDFAGRHVDHVGGHVGAFEIVGRDFDLLDLRLLDFLEERRGDLACPA